MSPPRFLGRVVDGAKAAPFMGFIDPRCPTARMVPPAGDGWLHEIKHDGCLAQAQLHDGARIYTRRGHDWAARMPTIAAAVSSLPVKSVILDGELVAVDAKGQVVFYQLPAAVGARPSRIAARLRDRSAVPRRLRPPWRPTDRAQAVARDVARQHARPAAHQVR